MQPQSQPVPPKTRKLSIVQFHTYCVQWGTDFKHPLTLKLAKGTAETLGAEIMPLQSVVLAPGTNLHIYTWDGCEFDCQSEQEIAADVGIDLTGLHEGHRENQMFFYLDLHYKLTKLRRLALENSTLGPRVLLIGQLKPQRLDIGRLLVNYAAKLNMEPIYVDLDPENIAFIDGSLSATHIRWRMPQNFMDYTRKLVYFYGSNRIHRKIYLQQVHVIAKATLEKLNRQLATYKEKGLPEEYPAFCSGLFVNLPNLKKLPAAVQREIVQDVIRAFDISHVLVLEDVTMLAFLNKENPRGEKARVEISSIPKLDKLENLADQRSRINKVDLYFSGVPGQSIFKRELKLNLSDIKCYEVKVAEDETPYCVQLDLSEMNIVKSTITILHAKSTSCMIVDDPNDGQYALAQKALNSPVCCLSRIHSIEAGRIDLHVIEQKFLQTHRNSLWIIGRQV